MSAKYHGIKLEYREHRHTVMDLLGQIRTKLRVWKRPYISPEAVRVLLQEWHVSGSCLDLVSLKKIISFLRDIGLTAWYLYCMSLLNSGAGKHTGTTLLVGSYSSQAEAGF